MKRRLLALLLVLAMVLSMAPMGVLAEDMGSSDDTGESGASYTNVTATARVDFWTEVSVEGYVSEWDRRGVTELTVVAAAFDYQQMQDSAYVTIPMEDVEDGSFTATLQLKDTFDQSRDIQIFLLDQGLQPVCSHPVSADWEQSLEGLDGDIQWSLSSGTLTLSGFFGLLSEMAPGYHEWDNYSSRVERIVTYNVQNISDSAFKDYESLYSVELGEGMETIGAYAFANDSGVVSITLPASLKTIGEYAFDGISSWTWIDFAEGFDWDNVTIGPGNDIIEAQRPTVDPDEDLTEIPDPTGSGEEEILEATEPTAETVPETTEVTVPETVPEAEEIQAEAENDYSDYYIAPEGAQLQEGGNLEELAAYTGTDKASKGYHTATFTGLVPLQIYFFIASRNPGSLEKDDLQAINLFGSDGDGNLTLTYVPKEETRYLVQLYGPEALTLEVNQDHVTLHPGESFRFTFTSNYDVDVWADIQNDRYDFCKNEDGTWTLTAGYDAELKECVTTYIEFVANNSIQTVRTRVRVDLVPQEATVSEATLGETKLTRNIYDSEATQIPILLTLDYPDSQVSQNEVNGIATFSAEQAEVGRLVQNVTFSSATDAAAKSLFQVNVQDDYTLLLSTAEGVDLTNAATVKAIKSSYKMGFHLTFADGTELDTGVLTLTVQKKLPTIKANTITLNPYYNATEFATFTGGNVQSFVDVAAPVSGIGAEAAEDGTVAVYLTAAPAKAAAKSLAIRVMVEGYSIPVKVTIPVKLDVKAPTAKLETTSWTIARHEWDNIWIPIQWTSKNISTEDMEFGTPTVLDSKGRVCNSYTAFLSEDSRLYLGTKDGDIRPAGKETLSIVVPVSAKDTQLDTPVTANLSFKVTVTNLDTVVKLAKSSVTLNAVDLDNVEAIVGLDVTRAGEKLSLDDLLFYYGLDCSNEEFADNLLDMFNIQFYSEGAVGFQLNLPYLEESGLDFDEVLAATYTFVVDVVGDESKIDNWAKLTIHLTQDATELTGLKATGTIDQINNESFVTLAATYRNSWGNRVPGVTVTDSKGNDCTELFVWSYDYNTDTIRLSANPAENDPDVGKYTVTLTNYSLGVTTSKSAVFTVKASKPTVKVTGKVDGLRSDVYATISSNYRQLTIDNVLIWPDVTLYTTGKNPTAVDPSLYSVYDLEDTGDLQICAMTYGEKVLPAGKYTAKLDYRDGTVLSAPITVTQTAVTFKLSKSSTTLHPRFHDGTWLAVSMTNAVSYTGNAGVEYYQSNGKTLWDDQNLIKAELDPVSGYVAVTPTGVEPSKDTTIKVKLYPDTRIPSKFTWLTVKVLGGKNLTQKFTLKATKTLDPSSFFPYTDLQCALKGFDNYYMEGTVKLLVSYDKGKTYEEASDYSGYAYGTHGTLDVNSPDPSLKYRAQVTYYGENGETAAIGTADLKVAFGSNKFTVAKAPTLYRENADEPMDIHLNAKSQSQRIDHITIKGNTGFTISKSVIFPENDISAGRYDWVLRYTGDKAKLKTTTLTLQIFLKGNTTTKPNATTTVKVTVK